MRAPMSIALRLGLGFGLVLSLMLLISLIGVQRVGFIDGTLTDVSEDAALKQRYAINFRGSVHDRAIAIRDAVLVEDAPALQQHLRDIERLGAFMQRPENQGKALRLAGFAAPGERTPIITLLTVNDRVDIIAQLLAARGVATEISRGFVGGIAVAPSGQARNERVEVWLVDRSSRM